MPTQLDFTMSKGGVQQTQEVEGFQQVTKKTTLWFCCMTNGDPIH